MVIAGADLACEIAARALAAAGVGRLRLLRDRAFDERSDSYGERRDFYGERSDFRADLRASNPELALESLGWPGGGDHAGTDEGQTPTPRRGEAWCQSLAGAGAVIRSGFDDDPMLRAAIRLGIPAVVVRPRSHGLRMVSFRRHGPCPHLSLEVPLVAAAREVDPRADANAVVVGHLAAAEVLVVLSGASQPNATARAGRARSLHIPFDGAAPTSIDIPWTPECFACGGSGAEATFR